jgi:cytochrome c oxidase cbb3-type subunit 3
MSTSWSLYIIIFVLLNIIGCAYFLFATAKQPKGETAGTLHGHIWDNDLQELNNPLPRWWLILFYLTIVFALAYLAVYPGLGNLSGALGWDSENAYIAEKKAFDEKYAAHYDQFLNTSATALAENPKAMKTARNVFLQHCAACHGADAAGAPGFPNLADSDWLYGNQASQIKTSIIQGRQGMMPGFTGQLDETQTQHIVRYIMSFTNRGGFDKTAINAGKQLFATRCAVCHGEAGQGNIQLGAPNLTDNVWLYGGDETALTESILKGRKGAMPTHKTLLSEGKIHLLTAYVLSVSNEAP